MAGRPYVTVHYAQTLDGRIATRTGHSQWISCPDTLRFAHQLRAQHAAVMVGAGTVCADDPRLTVRLVDGPSPLRVVVDSTLRIPPDATVLRDGRPTVVATTARASAERIDAVGQQGVDVLIVGEDSAGRVELDELLRRLRARGIDSVLIEGGARLITSSLRERLVDRLTICIAPKVIGSGIEAVGDLTIQHMDEALTFATSTFAIVGRDVIFDGQLARRAAPDAARR
jgi:5-amino-6-(5-phosphoribosylamino)uracil reductase/diaminohydroxyphosphoribosylaminopyrimidine deaminase/5-amino-6-(5-phosphoribosylamino)uracil reductase